MFLANTRKLYCHKERHFLFLLTTRRKYEKNQFQWVSNSNLAKLPKFHLLYNFKTGPKHAKIPKTSHQDEDALGKIEQQQAFVILDLTLWVLDSGRAFENIHGFYAHIHFKNVLEMCTLLPRKFFLSWRAEEYFVFKTPNSQLQILRVQ